MNELYGGKDPRNIPGYSLGDAARYLRIPLGTIRSWTLGRKYPVSRGSKFFAPLIDIPKTKPYLLSFTNLVEIHILRAIRKTHEIQMNKVREALNYLEETLDIAHPLATEEFRTDGVDLFVEKYGSLVNISKGGLLTLKLEFSNHLERIDSDSSGLAIKLYPFTRPHEENNPKIVVIDPRIAFGRLVIANTGIPTSILKERYLAGESIDDLAYDYDSDRLTIEEGIRCELGNAA